MATSPRTFLCDGLGRTPAEHQAMQLIAALDMEPVVYKLTCSEHGRPPKMTLEEADHNVLLYQQYLALSVLYPNQAIVPTQAVDEMWHAHALDTAKYREDTDPIFMPLFGVHFDHFPYFGLRGPEDERLLQEAFVVTCDLYRLHFKVELAPERS